MHHPHKQKGTLTSFLTNQGVEDVNQMEAPDQFVSLAAKLSVSTGSTAPNLYT